MSTKKKEELGKGIRALLGGIDENWKNGNGVTEEEGSSAGTIPAVSSISSIALTKIEVNPFQPRADFDKEGLQELSESISTHGVIQPITVRSVGGGKYQLIAGERRLRASKMAGMKDIPAYIRKANDQEMLEIALIENIQREDLNAVEIAVNYKRLIDECKLTQEELGTRLGKNRATVTNYLRLLKLPPEIQKGIKEKFISMGHARAIINLDDPTLQLSVYKEIVRRTLSVRKVEELVRAYQGRPASDTTVTKEKPKLPLAYQKIQDELSSRFSTKVKLNAFKGDKGEIVISYFSDDDLNRILDVLTES